MPDREKIPWWLWPNVLSLDAPVVAVVWLGAFSRAFHFDAGWPVYAVLFLVVWLIYTGDRLYDARKNEPGEDSPPRHRFVRKNLLPVAAALPIVAAAILGLVANYLPDEVSSTGLIVGMLVGVYFLFFVWKQVPGKEIAAGMIFAIGVVLPAKGDPSGITEDWIPALLMFGLICAFNCYLVDGNERTTGGAMRRRGGAIWLGFSLMIAAVILAARQMDLALIFLSLALSAGFLAGLQMLRNELSRNAFRALADVALLTPVIWLPLSTVP